MKRFEHSYSTIKTYKSLFISFLVYYSDFQPEAIATNQIKDYVLHRIQKMNISESTQNQVINAIKFYYEKVLGQERKTYYVQRPKKPKQLPEVLSEPYATFRNFWGIIPARLRRSTRTSRRRVLKASRARWIIWTWGELCDCLGWVFLFI